MSSFDIYTITRAKIARGGTGVVHAAKAPDGRRVAIKVLDRKTIEEKIIRKFERDNPEAYGDSTRLTEKTRKAYELNVARFKEEYQTLIGLDHPNVATVYKTGFHEGQFYIVSEFIDGLPIAEYVRGWKPPEMVPLFIQALRGLDFIHRSGLIHLDIKSENILVQEIDGRPCAKIIDFGLAMAPKEYGGGFFGSVSSMAPEVALGRKDKVDARADLFSFGSVMYYCITWGNLPFPRPSKGDRDDIRHSIEREAELTIDPPSDFHRSRDGYVPEFLDTIVMRLLAHRPEDRFYGNARAVMNALSTHMPDAFVETKDALGSYLIPEGNEHIGRKEERKKIFATIGDLIKRPHRQPKVLAIEGGRGLGKSHLLKKISDMASRNAEAISIHSIGFPADAGSCRAFVDRTSFVLAENSRPVVILVDDVDELAREAQGNARHPAYAEAMNLLRRAAALAYERKTRPDLFAGTVPIFMCVAYDVRQFSRRKIVSLLETTPRNIDGIILEPLTYLDVDSYLKSTPALKGAAIPRDRVDAIYEQTGGIPAEIRELLEAVDSRGLLFNLEGEILSSLPPKVDQRPPPSTEARLASTYRLCNADERRIIHLLAVWNHLHMAPPMLYNDVYHFLPLPSLRQRIENLVSRGILVSRMDDNALSFHNGDFFPSLIYREMDPDEACGWHGRIWRYLKTRDSPLVARRSRNADTAGGLPSHETRVTNHDLALLHRSFMEPSAETYRAIMRLARKKLTEDGDLHIAGQLGEHALDLVPENRPRLNACFAALLASVYQQEGRYSLAAHITEGALEGIETPANCRGLAARLLLQLGAANLRMRDYKNARAAIGRALRLYRRWHRFAPSCPNSIALLNLAARYIYERALAADEGRGKLLECAKGLYERCENLEAPLPPDARNAIRNGDTGLVHIALGNYEAAAHSLKGRLDRYAAEKYHFGILQTTIALASACRLLGRFGEAKGLAEDAVKLAKRSYQGKWLPYAHQTLAYAYHDMDRFDLALAEDDQWFASSAILESTEEHRRSSALIWNHKGHCHKELSQFDSARMCFQAVLESRPDAFSLMYAHEGLGETFFLMGDIGKSDRHLREAQALLDRMPPKASLAYRFPIGMLRAEILHKKGRIADALSLLGNLKELSLTDKKWKAQYERLDERLRSAVPTA